MNSKAVPREASGRVRTLVSKSRRTRNSVRQRIRTGLAGILGSTHCHCVRARVAVGFVELSSLVSALDHFAQHRPATRREGLSCGDSLAAAEF